MKKNKQPKYKSKKVEIDGITFASQIEGDYYLKLKKDKELGLIRDFVLQPIYELQSKFIKNNKSTRAINLQTDFDVIDYYGEVFTIDIKGFPTEAAKLKRKMFDFKYPGKQLKWIAYSVIDGGWIEYDDLKKARKLRKKEKAALK